MLKKIMPFIVFLGGLLLGLGLMACAHVKPNQPTPSPSVSTVSTPSPSTTPAPAPTNYVNPDPLQQPVLPLAQTDPKYDLPGDCLPSGNGDKVEATDTFCGSAASGGKDFDTNKNGDKFKAVLHRQNASSQWSVEEEWSAGPGVEILVNFAQPDVKTSKLYFHQEVLTGSGKKSLIYSDYPGKVLRYFSWQAYPIPTTALP